MKKVSFTFLVLFGLVGAVPEKAAAQSDADVRFVHTLPSACLPTARRQVLWYLYTASGRGLYYCSADNTFSLVGDTAYTAPTLTPGSVLFADADGEIAEDNDSFFFDATSGFLTIGHNARFFSNSLLEVTGSAPSTPTIGAGFFGTGSRPQFVGFVARGTQASPTASQSVDEFVRFGGMGYGATGFPAGAKAYLSIRASENWTDTAQGTNISFAVTPTGSTATNSYANLTSTEFKVARDMQLAWTSNATGTLGLTPDTGLARRSAGVIRVTNGSTAIRGLLGGGSAVASAAALPLPTGRVFHVTGTTNITSITSTNFASGVCITLIFDNALTFTDGSNLKLAGDFVTTADDTISLCYDGTNWYETGRSVN